MLATGKLSPDAIPGEFVTLDGIVFMYCCSRMNLLIASLALARLHAGMAESMLLRGKFPSSTASYSSIFFLYGTINNFSEKYCLKHCIDTKHEVKQVKGGSRDGHGKYQGENVEVSCCHAVGYAWISGKKNAQ